MKYGFYRLNYLAIKSTPDWTCTSNLRFKRPILFYWVTGVYGGDGRNRTYIEFNNSHDLTGRCSAIEPHPQCSLHGAIWTLNLTNPNGADYQVFPRADVNNIFLKRIYQNSSTSIGYCPQFFALSRQPSTFEHILVYVVLLECAAHSTYQLKADYSTVELQKHGAHKKIWTPAPTFIGLAVFKTALLSHLSMWAF